MFWNIESFNEHDVIACKKWACWDDFREEINRKVNYVLLRNESILPNSVSWRDSDDLDILCENRDEFIEVTGAIPLHREKSRGNFVVWIGNSKIKVDVRYVGDGYYPHNWQENMLKYRTQSINNVFVMNNENLYFSLAYHALLQKKAFPQKYASVFPSPSKLVEELKVYAKKNGYKYEFPQDARVVVNWLNVVKVFGLKEIKLCECAKYLYRRNCYDSNWR